MGIAWAFLGFLRWHLQPLGVCGLCVGGSITCVLTYNPGLQAGGPTGTISDWDYKTPELGCPESEVTSIKDQQDPRKTL